MPNCSVDFEAAGPAHMATDRAIRLALLVTELVTNAAKHAYGSEGGRISVKLALRDPLTATVSVIDEGVGLPDAFRADRVGGLGMRLINALVEQMDGALRIDRRAQGASFTVDVALG
jgi:two-component sensor histidine kinase